MSSYRSDGDAVIKKYNSYLSFVDMYMDRCIDIGVDNVHIYAWTSTL